MVRLEGNFVGVGEGGDEGLGGVREGGLECEGDEFQAPEQLKSDGISVGDQQ